MKRLTTALLSISALLFSACQNAHTVPVDDTSPTLPVAASETPAPTPPKLETPALKLPTLRIDAGSETPVTDAKGNLWAPDSGFDGGGSVNRSDTPTTGTDLPELFKTEHHSMNSWSTKLPNGDYTLKLFFAENYSAVTGPDDRLFTITVLDGPADSTKSLKEIKDFSIFKLAGGSAKAYVEAIPVTITTGQLTIKFTEQAQHPEINAIEITPK